MNGSNGYTDMGTINPTGNFSTGVTIECWVKWDAFNTWSRLVDMGNGAANNNIFLGNWGTLPQLRFEAFQGGTMYGVSSPVTMVTGRWYHVAATQTAAGLVTLYIDGVAVTSATLPVPLNISRTSNFIGRSNWTADAYLDAKMDELRIWSVARTASEIRSNMLKTVAANATGLVAYYRCNEGSGTALVNACTNGGAGNGTVISGTAWISSPAQQAANAINLDGTDDHAFIGAPLSANSSYTKEAWVYVTKSTSLPQNIISSRYSPLWIDGGQLRGGNNGASANVIDPGTFPDNTWTHVALTYDAATQAMRLYKNGVLVNSATVALPYQNENNYIGAWYNGTSTESYLGGSVDEVRIWNTARTQAQIQADMNKELNASAEASLVAYYTFNQGTTAGDNTGFTTMTDQKTNTNAALVNLGLSSTTSNFVAQQSGLVLLPVNFRSFAAQKQGAQTLLQWTTAGEQNVQRFAVEHSTDGTNWTTVGDVAAAGNSNAEQRYSLVHTTPVKGLNRYRIRLVESGKTTYSDVRTVSFSETMKMFDVQGNVVAGGQIKVNVTQRCVLSLLAQDAKIIWTKQVSEGTQTLPVSGLAGGVYYLTNGSETEKLVIR